MRHLGDPLSRRLERMVGWYLPRGAVVAGYPLDGLSNIAVAYSTRRLLTSWAGNLIRLRRDSDAGESDFGYDANGDLDTAAVAAWLGAATGYFVTWYDQSGNGVNATQAVAASQPRYDATGLNNKPSLEWFDTNSRFLTYNATFPATLHGVFSFSTTYASIFGLWGDKADGLPGFNLNFNANRPIEYLGAANFGYFVAETTFRDGNPHIHSVYIAGAGQNDIDNRAYRLDGTTIAQDASNKAGTITPVATTDIGVKNAGLNNGLMAEFVVFSAQLSTADHNQAGSALATYAGATWNTIV